MNEKMKLQKCENFSSAPAILSLCHHHDHDDDNENNWKWKSVNDENRR